MGDHVFFLRNILAWLDLCLPPVYPGLRCGPPYSPALMVVLYFYGACVALAPPGAWRSSVSVPPAAGTSGAEREGSGLRYDAGGDQAGDPRLAEPVLAQDLAGVLADGRCACGKSPG